MFAFQRLAEERIRQAEREGQFERLPGKGRPLALRDESSLHPELRMAYHVLKNAGYIPPELDAYNELSRAEDLLANAPDEQSRYQALKRVKYLTMKLGELRPGSALLDQAEYSHRVVERLGRPPGRSR